MVGVELPVLAMEHMYLLTEPMPEVEEFNKATGREMVGVHRLQGRDLHAPGAQRHPARHLREGLQAVVAGQHAVGFRPRAAAARPRPHRAVAGDRLQAFPRHREGRHQADHQRPLHLRARRQSAGRPGAGPDQFLVRLRRHGRLQPGRRRRPGAVQLDGATAIPASTSGAWTSPASANGRRLRYTNAKVRENYSRRFSIRFPNEELPAARPAQTTPLYDTMVAQNAVMGDSAGAWRRRSGSRRRASSRRTSSPSTAPTISSMSATRCARRANASASPRSPTSPNTRSPGRARRISSTG